MNTQSQPQRRNSFELEVVSTELLLRHLKPWMQEWDRRHPKKSGRQAKYFVPEEHLQINAKEKLAEAAGVSPDRIDHLVYGNDSKYTVLSMADTLLTCAGKEHLLATGDIPVFPNPIFTPEKWAERMRERGCYD